MTDFAKMAQSLAFYVFEGFNLQSGGTVVGNLPDSGRAWRPPEVYTLLKALGAVV